MTAEQQLAKWKKRGGAGPTIVTVHGRLPDGFKVLDPAAMQFRAYLLPEDAVDSCAGCVFHRQDAKVCKEAGRLARLAEVADCDDKDPATGRTHIYKVPAQDVRQLSIIEGEKIDPA